MQNREGWFNARHSQRQPSNEDIPLYDRVLENAKQNDEKLSQILTTAQRKRLRQIAIQLQGPTALRDMTVIGELEINKEQKLAIQTEMMKFFR